MFLAKLIPLGALFALLGTTQAAHAVIKQTHHHPATPRIIGGDEAVPHSAPYNVAIWAEYIWSTVFCGGSLISKNYVLTAAHCLYGATTTKLILGAHNATDATEPHQISFPNATYKVHGWYDPYYLHHDIALIKLPEPVDFNEFIQPIKLPAKENRTQTYVKDVARAYGWGITHDPPPHPVKSDVLLFVDVPVIENSVCLKEFPNVIDGNICTSNDGVKGTCHGDSGGPLVLDGRIIGITSYGNETYCEKGPYSVYTNVGKYLTWIQRNSDVGTH